MNNQPMMSQMGNKTQAMKSWHFREFWIMTLVPTSFFILLLSLYSSLYLTNRGLCFFFTIVCSIVSLSLLLLRAQGPGFNFPVGMNCTVATVMGVFLGLYVFDTYGIFPQFYHNARKYTNVVPSESALAVADAGKIVFSANTKVMTGQAMSYVSESGQTYCVGPVSDGSASYGSNAARVQFWAAGMGCCEGGDFHCDASKDSKATGGIVIFDNLGWFGASRMDYYNKARKKAEAQYKLTSILEPMFVRWVTEEDLDWLEHDYQMKAAIFSIVAILAYLGLSFGWSMTMFTPRAGGR